MKKALGLSLIIIVLLISVFAVSAEGDDPITLTYFTFSAAPDHLEELDQMIAIFEAQNPGIKIEVQTAAYDDYFTLLQSRIAGGDAPDVFELNYENFVSYAAKGVLLDISPLAEADSFDTSIYYPKSLEAFQYEGKQLGLPETFSTVVLYYNKDAFDAAGLDYPTADWTWADAIAASKEIMTVNPDMYGIYSGVSFFEFYKKAAQNGCDFFNEDKTEVLINSDACVSALETMLSLMDEGVMPTSEEMAGMDDGTMFVNQNLAMTTTGIWMFASFSDADFNWDITVEPGMQEKATHFFSNSVNIYADTEYADAAYKWVSFFTSNADAADIRIQSGWELPTLTNPEYLTSYLEQTPPANRQAVFDSLEFAVVPPTLERQAEMQDAVGAALDQAVLGILTPQEALDLAKMEIEALLP